MTFHQLYRLKTVYYFYFFASHCMIALRKLNLFNELPDEFFPRKLRYQGHRYLVIIDSYIVLQCNTDNINGYKMPENIPKTISVFFRPIPVIGIYFIFPDDTRALVLHDYPFNFFFQNRLSVLFEKLKFTNDYTRIKPLNVELYLDQNVKRVVLSTRTKRVEAAKDSKYSFTDSKGQFFQFYPLELSLCPMNKKKISIKETIVSIGPFSFNYNMYVVSVKFPASVETINRSAFSCCVSLKRLIFPKTSRLQLICCNAFKNCYELKIVNFPPSLKVIKLEAFIYCKNLKKVTFGAEHSLLRIGYRAFAHTGFEHVTILPNVKYEPNSFEECRKIKSACYSESITTIGSLFLYTSIKEVKIPASAISISKYAFSYYKRLNSVTFCEPSKLQTIEENAFSHTLIAEINIPASVETICYHAFKECKKLTNVTFGNNSRLKTLGKDAFQETPLKSIVVPVSTEIEGKHYHISEQHETYKILTFNYKKKFHPMRLSNETYMMENHAYY